jgi:hypothetical protein
MPNVCGKFHLPRLNICGENRKWFCAKTFGTPCTNYRVTTKFSYKFNRDFFDNYSSGTNEILWQHVTGDLVFVHQKLFRKVDSSVHGRFRKALPFFALARTPRIDNFSHFQSRNFPHVNKVTMPKITWRIQDLLRILQCISEASSTIMSRAPIVIVTVEQNFSHFHWLCCQNQFQVLVAENVSVRIVARDEIVVSWRMLDNWRSFDFIALAQVDSGLDKVNISNFLPRVSDPAQLMF